MVPSYRIMSIGCFLLAFSASCGGRLPRPIPVEAEGYQVYYSDQSRIQEVRELVIRDSVAWTEEWTQATGSEADLPHVDFEEHMLLLVNAGSRHPGDRVQIERLEHEEGGFVVRYRIEACGTLESEVFPIQVVRVERRRGRPRFEGQLKTEPYCR
ncbi:hypothetical protein ACFL3S_08945 [Gemmatimonadota bacterium]